MAGKFQPSFYDSIIKLKQLPYLPDIVSAKAKYVIIEKKNIFFKKQIYRKDFSNLHLLSTWFLLWSVQLLQSIINIYNFPLFVVPGKCLLKTLWLRRCLASHLPLIMESWGIYWPPQTTKAILWWIPQVKYSVHVSYTMMMCTILNVCIFKKK